MFAQSETTILLEGFAGKSNLKEAKFKLLQQPKYKHDNVCEYT